MANKLEVLQVIGTAEQARNLQGTGCRSGEPGEKDDTDADAGARNREVEEDEEVVGNGGVIMVVPAECTLAGAVAVDRVARPMTNLWCATERWWTRRNKRLQLFHLTYLDHGKLGQVFLVALTNRGELPH